MTIISVLLWSALIAFVLYKAMPLIYSITFAMLMIAYKIDMDRSGRHITITVQKHKTKAGQRIQTFIVDSLVDMFQRSESDNIDTVRVETTEEVKPD